MNYYNEWDSFAAAWLKELIKDGLIPNGEVDSRSIADVEPSDLKGFTQCHFFAGIGGWSRALQLAGWSPGRPVWTGSPPCQSFSTAGKGKGKDDERHLWPVFFNLIRECQPPTVFGEQVAAAIRYGWLDDLQADFEKEGYASAAVVLPAGGIGAPHKRDRLFFVADSHNERHERSSSDGRQAQRRLEHSGSVSVADPINERSQRGVHRREDSEWENINGHTGCSGSTNTLGDTQHDGSYEAKIGRSTGSGKAESGMLELERSDSLFWGSSEVIYCRDGKYRPIPTEPGFLLLADGFWYRMADVITDINERAIRGIEAYAKISERRPDQVLLELREGNEKEAIQWEIARQGGVPAPEVLLPILRDVLSTQDIASFSRFGEEKSEQIEGRILRDLRVSIESSCPSLRYESIEQRIAESANPLSALSWVLALCESQARQYHSRQNEACFPLCRSGVKGRVGILRGAGNAIVPQAAAEIIKAYMT